MLQTLYDLREGNFVLLYCIHNTLSKNIGCCFERTVDLDASAVSTLIYAPSVNSNTPGRPEISAFAILSKMFTAAQNIYMFIQYVYSIKRHEYLLKIKW